MPRTIVISDAQRRARLALRHLLAPGTAVDDVAGIADEVVALHSTDPATVYLSALARMASPSIAAVASALYEQRSLLRHHGMRRTLWVMTPDCAGDVHAACTAAIARNEWRRLEKYAANSGITDPPTWTAAMAADTVVALRRLGPMTARHLGKAVPDLTTKLTAGSGAYVGEQSAHTRLLLNLGFDATVVRTRPSGSWINSEYTWTPMDDWIPGGLADRPQREATAGLMRRYVHSFGPVTTADVQWWTGLTLGAVRTALADIDATEVTLEGGGPAWMLEEDLPMVVEVEPWVALLPGLDPTPMGWKERCWYLGEHGTIGGPLFDRSGNVGPTVWVNGEVVGAWAQRRDGRVDWRLLRTVDTATEHDIADAAELLTSLIGDVRVTPRFPTLLQKEIGAAP